MEIQEYEDISLDGHIKTYFAFLPKMNNTLSISMNMDFISILIDRNVLNFIL